MLPVLMEQSQAVEIRSRRLHASVTLSTVLGGGDIAGPDGSDQAKPE